MLLSIIISLLLDPITQWSFSAYPGQGIKSYYSFFFILIILLFEQNGQTALDIAHNRGQHEFISYMNLFISLEQKQENLYLAVVDDDVSKAQLLLNEAPPDILTNIDDSKHVSQFKLE